MTPYLSVIIPVYNESSRLHTLPQIYRYFSRFKFPFELIVVNDGSTDNTLTLLKNLQSDFSFTIINYSKNRGKGYALKKGMLTATGKFRIFMDVDLSTPLTEFQKFRPHLGKFDILIGSRKTTGAHLKKRQPYIREFLGKCFTFLSQLILNTYLTDFTCGFKIFSAFAAQQIFSHLTIARWGFDSEALFLARLYGFSIQQIPVTWVNDPKSRVNLLKDVPRSLNDLLTIRLNQLRGAYKC